ncbi:MAG: flippase [Candidatus Krumholzibacteria bacterium]|nr:flippase [Candidatus Krumholzibacteria bacterium]
MSETATQSVARNTLLLTIGLLAGRILAIFVTKKMTPILGPAGLGIWGLANDIGIILLTVINYGLGVLLTRDITRNRGLSWPLLWAALRLRWLLGAACFLLLLVYLHTTDKDPLTSAAVLVTALGLFAETSAMACDAVLQAHEKVKYQTYGQLVSAAVYFVLAYWWLDAGYGLMGVVWANVASRVVRLAVMAPLMFWQTGPWRRALPGEQAPDLRSMLRLGFALCMATTFGIISYKIDTVMLTEMVGKAATGIYVLGHRALDILLVVPNLFVTALFPALARYMGQSRLDARRLGERALRYMLTAMVPVTWLVVLGARPVIEWFARGTAAADPSQFADSIFVMQLVVWGVPFQSASFVLNRTLIAAGRERVFLWIGVAALATNVTLNLLLIPRYGYYGASVATVICLAQSLALQFWVLRGTPEWLPPRRALLGPTAALLVSWFAASALLHQAAPAWTDGWLALNVTRGWTPFLGGIALWAVCYAAAVFGMRILDRDDLRLLPQLLRRSG